MITENELQNALSRILVDQVRSGDTGYGFASRLDELEIDSLLMAELIVELEDEVGALLDFRPVGRLETLGDLCRALERLDDAE